MQHPVVRNIEALRLYRAVLRAAREFTWPDERGTPWCNILIMSARKEMEAHREVDDPKEVARLLVAGNEALAVAQNKFLKEKKRLQDEVELARMENRQPEFDPAQRTHANRPPKKKKR